MPVVERRVRRHVHARHRVALVIGGLELAEGIERQILRKGLQVSTPQADEDDAVLFETMRDLTVVSARLDRCFSYFDETYSDNSPYINGERGEGFLAFAGAERVDRFIYLGDDRLLTINESTVLRLRLTAPEHGGRDLSRLLEWEYWNGRRWRELVQAPLEVERGEVIFAGVADMQPTTVNGVQTFWLRGRLAEVPKKLAETEVDTVRGTIEVLGEGILPDQAFANLDNNVFIALDLGKNIHPFGNEPKIDHCLYLSSQETFSQQGVQVEIDFNVSDPTVVPPPRVARGVADDHAEEREYVVVIARHRAGLRELEEGHERLLHGVDRVVPGEPLALREGRQPARVPVGELLDPRRESGPCARCHRARRYPAGGGGDKPALPRGACVEPGHTPPSSVDRRCRRATGRRTAGGTPR